MPKPRRKSFGAACHAISSTAEFEEGQDDDDFDSDSESCSSEPPMDDPKSPSSDEEENIIDPSMSVHITDDAITPECMAKLQPTVLLEDCLSPNVSRQNTASPVPLNNDWKPSPLAGTQKQSDLDNKQQPKRQQRSDHRALKKARERSGSPVHNLLSRILTKKTGIETVLSPLSKDKPSGDKSPEAAPSPDSLNPDSPGESSAREGLEENKTSTVTPLKENLALTRTRLTSSPAVYESPTKSQFTRVHGSPYPPGSPQMSPVVVLHDCCTPPRGTRQTRAQRMASWYVEEDDDDDDEMAELLEKEEEEEYVFPEPLSTSAESFFGRKVEATVEIHGETLAESSLYHSLSCSSKRRQALLAPVPTRRARYSLRHAKQHFKNGCIINGNDEITFISSTKTTAKELLKETRRRQRSLHFTPSPVHRRNKRFKGEGKTGDPPSRMSTRLQRQRAPVTSSPEESQDDCLTAEELPPTSEEPMEDPAGLHDQSNVVFYDEVILCPEEDDFQEDSSTAELPHSSWSLSPPTTRPQSTGSGSPPIREEPCSPPPITELLTSRSPPITVCQPTRSESPPIREEPCSPPPIIELLTSRSPPITVHQSPRSESPPIREEPCNKGFESPPIREEPSSSVTVVQPITDHNSTTGSNFQPIMEQDSKAGSENPPITEEETTTEPQPTVDQPSNFESQSPPIKSQTSLLKSSPSPNTVEQPTTSLPSPLNNSLQTIKDQSPSSSDKSEDDSPRIQSPILEEEEDDTYEEPETEALRYVTVSRRGHEDTPLPGRRLSSRVAQALAEEGSITATQVGKSHQTVEQSQDQATSGGGRKLSRETSKQKKPTRQQKGIELVAEETGQEKGEENTKNDQNVVEDQSCSLDENEASDKECHAPDVAMATSDVAMETSSIPEEEPIGDFPEIVFKGTAENNVDTPEVSQREANFSDTTKGGEDIIVEHEDEEEAGPKRPRRFRKPAAKPAPSSAVKLRKGRGRKQEEDIEVIYRNKNYKAPEQKTFETIYEDPIVRKKTGEEQLVGRSMKRRVSFRNFYYPKKMNKKKASKNVKRFRRKSLEGVTVDEKLINLDRQMIGISPAKFCLPGDQMLFQFASQEASSDLVMVKEEPLDLIDEENHQALDLSGVGPLDEEEKEDIAQESEIKNKEVHSQGELLQEKTEQQAEKDSTNTRKPGRKRRRSSLTAQAKIKVLENISQINSESDDHMPRNSKKSRRKSSSLKQDSRVSLSADMSKETSGSSSETTEEVEVSRLPEHVSLSSSESATTSELEGEVTQGKKRGRRKSIQSNKPVDTASSDRQASDLNSVDLAINAVLAGKYFEEPPNQTTPCVLSVPVEPPMDDLQNADGKGRGQNAKTKGQANGKGSNPEGKIEVETTEQSTDALGLTEEGIGNMKGKTARQRSRRRSLLLSQQSSSVEEENERNTEASNSEEEKLPSSQEPGKKKTPRRKSVLPPTLEDASSATEDQDSAEDDSSLTVKKKGRRRSTMSTAKQDTVEDFSQQSRLTEEQTLEEGYSTESSVSSVVVRRSRRKSVLLQQSSSEDCSQPAKEQGAETDRSEETSATTSVARKRSRRRSVVIHRSGSLSEEGMETCQWSGSELSCNVPLPGIRSVKTRKTRRQDIIPDSSTCENVERAMSESEESHVSTASGPVTTRRSRRRSVLLKMSSANEEDSRPPDNVSLVKIAKHHMESLGEAGVTSTVLKEEPNSISAEHQTDDKTGQIEEPQVDRKEHQSENDLNPWGCSSQESASSQSVGGFGDFVEDEASGVSRRKRKRRKSVLLKQFSWAGESPPGITTISENFGTKAEERKQTEKPLPSCSQQTREEGVENVPDCLESDDVVSFNLEVSRKETELKEVHSDAEATDSEAILPAKKAKRSLCGNNEEKNQTSDSSESVVDSQAQVSTVRKRRKSIFKKATNEEKIVTSSTDIPQDILNNDDYDELQSTEVQSDLQTVTQASRRQKRKRAAGPVVSNQSSEEMSTSDKEDKTETFKSEGLPTGICNEESRASAEKVEGTMSEDQVSEKQPKKRGRRKSQSFRPEKMNKFLSENQDAESTTPNQTEEDFVTRDKTYTDEKHTEITDEPKRKVRRQSARFRRASTPKKMASPKTTPAPDNDLMFEEDFVTNDDTFIDNEQIESLINSIAEGNTPVGSPCNSVSTKIADVNVEKDIKKPRQKKAKTRKKNAGKRAATRGRKKAELPKTPKESSPQNRKPAKTPKDSSPQNSKPTSTVSPKLRVAESNKTATPVDSEENGFQDNTCSIRKEKKAKKGGKSLSPATNEPKIHENGDKTTAMLSPTSQNNLKKTPGNKTPSSALQSHTDNGKSSQKSSPTTPSQSQKREVIMKEPPHSPETVFSPKSRDQARQISSLFSVLSRSTSSPDANQSLLGAMPSFKSLVKDVVSPETTVNSSQPVQDTNCDTRKPSKPSSFASKANASSKSTNNTTYSSKPGLLAEQTPQAESCGSDVASSFSCHGNTSWKDTTVSNSGKSKSFTFAKAYSAKQHWAKRFMNTKDTYLNKFKMFAFGSPSSQSSAEENS
ncbi:PREDICTED: uncharacterized protein LOC109476275 [Branchiostoma belcheri]|uniref:Uncharacterized protein LOC109476275 n=1 Tax=Branchiostoma belcheri TaxID=7741 RepID=A0A6P4Z7U5_BRABE|nr:PREDICTED: uncharacterized protein LOC109476275 [Branchiostoma belcheri]